jgi:hypothetical protein
MKINSTKERICNVCNNKFVIKFSYQKRCSKECQIIFVRNQSKINMRKYNYYKPVPIQEKICIICNNSFLTNRKNTKVCNAAECRRIHKKNIDYKNGLKCLGRNKKYFELHKDELKRKSRIYALKNKDRINELSRNRCKILRKTNIEYKLSSSIRSRIYRALKCNWKSGHTIELIGCSILVLKQYLENIFQPFRFR